MIKHYKTYIIPFLLWDNFFSRKSTSVSSKNLLLRLGLRDLVSPLWQ